MTDFNYEDPPAGWQPSAETIRKMQEAPVFDADAHLGGAKEGSLGEKWLAEQERVAADRRKQSEVFAELTAVVARFSERLAALEKRPAPLHQSAVVGPIQSNSLGVVRVVVGGFVGDERRQFSGYPLRGTEKPLPPPAWLAHELLEG
jgi:hypothetical protein